MLRIIISLIITLRKIGRYGLALAFINCGSLFANTPDNDSIVEESITEPGGATDDDHEDDDYEDDDYEDDDYEDDDYEDDDYEDDDYEDDDYEDDDYSEAGDVSDPLYYLNFVMYKVNDRLYFWLLKPAAKGYNKFLPEYERVGIKNFFTNLSTPVRFANCILQRKFKAAGTELAAFSVNTTIGILGFRNLAKRWYQLDYTFEDLGQTLAVYGLGNGFYLVIPLLGPSSLRDFVGSLGDGFLTPIHYLPTFWRLGVRSLQSVNDTSLRIGEYEQLIKSAISPYDSLRNVYIQYREAQINQ